MSWRVTSPCWPQEQISLWSSSGYVCQKAGAFAFILEKRFEGVILSGTKSPDHLEENWRAYSEALARPAGHWSCKKKDGRR